MSPGRYAAMRWNTPLSEAHAAWLIDQLEVASVGSVLDLGCGWGELLIRVVEAAGGECAGVGVDTDEALLDRGRRSTHARGLDTRVSFVSAPAQEWDQPAERVLCIGASHAWGGTAPTLAALRAQVTPGGRLLYGDGCWETGPTPAAAEIFGDEVLRLSEVVEHARSAGWRAISVTTADQREWDEFESTWRRGPEEWLLVNPDGPDAGNTRAELDQRLAEYLDVYRGVLGFCYLVLTA